MTVGILPLLVAISNQAPLNVVEEAFNNFSAEYMYGDASARIAGNDVFLDQYDFIVIGAGTGGCVMANRLSEYKQWNVLLLEAGKEENFLLSVPLAATLNTKAGYSWDYQIEPMDTACFGLPNRVCPLPRGRGLGGSTLLNYMIYTRGHQRDFDELVHAGNFGWSYNDVLPYFEKGEKSYLKISQNPYESPYLNSFYNALEEIGYRKIDPNDKIQLGYYKLRTTTSNGRRHSASSAYLYPVRNRPNLHISANSHVTRILLNPTTKSAYGVEFVKNGKLYRINANKEVILSAGAISSPQLLMLSGIGPEEHLASLSIPVIKSLPVGYNLHDHYIYRKLEFHLSRPVPIGSTAHLFQEYITNGTGPFALTVRREAVSYLKTPSSKLPRDYPDVEIFAATTFVNREDSDINMQLLGLPNVIKDTDFVFNPGEEKIQLIPFMMRPNGRGRITLRSINPFEYPRIDANYLANPEDVRTLIEGIKIGVLIGESQHFAKFGPRLMPVQECEHLRSAARNDEYWKCCIRYYGSGTFHQSGTCKMGPECDPTAVVSPTLQVHGVSNLRVVDVSILPQPVAAHINAVVFMIAEKAADMVKMFWSSGCCRDYRFPYLKRCNP